MTSQHISKPCRILILSDQVAMFLGIRAALCPGGQHAAPDYASTIEDAIAKLRKGRYDILIWCVPAKTGEIPRGIARFKSQTPVTRILVMGDAFTCADVSTIVRAGASGYVPLYYPFEKLRDFFQVIFYGADSRTLRVSPAAKILCEPEDVKIFDLERDGLFG